MSEYTFEGTGVKVVFKESFSREAFADLTREILIDDALAEAVTKDPVGLFAEHGVQIEIPGYDPEGKIKLRDDTLLRLLEPVKRKEEKKGCLNPKKEEEEEEPEAIYPFAVVMLIFTVYESCRNS